MVLEDFNFSDIYDAYYGTGAFSNWDILLMARDFWDAQVTLFIFWTVVFIIVYASLHLTTGGVSIPAAVFSATGMILVTVMPVQLGGWAYLLIATALFILPLYKYFKS